MNKGILAAIKVVATIIVVALLTSASSSTGVPRWIWGTIAIAVITAIWKYKPARNDEQIKQ